MKRSMIIGILALTLVLAACDNTREQTNVPRNPYRGGTDSLSFSFDPQSPPSETFADTGFFVGIQVKNTGEYTVPQNELKLKIQGINPSDYGLSQSEKTATMDLTGTVYNVDGDVIEGSEDYIEFGPLRYTDELRVAMNDVPIQTRACYSYGTDAVSSICVKQNVLSDEDDDVCVVSEEKDVFSSSAPVQITSMKESPRGSGSIAFSFQIEHQGTGKVYAPSAPVNCDDDNAENTVLVSVDGPEGLECPTLGGSTTGEVKISKEGGRMVTCKLDVSTASSDYVQPVTMMLEYTYQQLLTKQIDIKPIN